MLTQPDPSSDADAYNFGSGNRKLGGRTENVALQFFVGFFKHIYFLRFLLKLEPKKRNIFKKDRSSFFVRAFVLK